MIRNKENIRILCTWLLNLSLGFGFILHSNNANVKSFPALQLLPSLSPVNPYTHSSSLSSTVTIKEDERVIVSSSKNVVKQILNLPSGSLSQKDVVYLINIMKKTSSMARYGEAKISKIDTSTNRSFISSSPARRDAIVIEKILDRLLEEYREGNEYVHESLDVRIFNLCIFGWANSGVKGSGKATENVLRKLQNFQQYVSNLHNKDLNIQPDVYTYSTIFYTWCREINLSTKDKGGKKIRTANLALRKSEEILEEMGRLLEVQFSPPISDASLKELNRNFSIIINNWGKFGDCNVIDYCSLRFLHYLENFQHTTIVEESKPQQIVNLDIRTYNNALTCLISADRFKKERGLSNFSFQSNTNKLPPSLRDFVSSYNYNGLLDEQKEVILSLTSDSRDKKTSSQIEILYEHILSFLDSVQPDKYTFTHLFSSLEPTMDIPPRTTNKLVYEDHFGDTTQKMIRYLADLESDPCIKPDTPTYNTALKTLSKCAAICTTLNKYDKTRNSDFGMIAQNIFDRMVESSAKPNLQTVNHVIAILSAEGKFQQAEDILKQMLPRHGSEKSMNNNKVLGFQPNSLSFTTLIDAYALFGRVQDAHRIFELMQNLYMSNGKRFASLKPTPEICNSLLSHWVTTVTYSSSKYNNAVLASQKAEGILETMESLNYSIDTKTYNKVMQIYSLKKTKKGALEAEGLLTKMQEMYKCGNTHCKPDTISYTTAINAWASRGIGLEGALRADAILSSMEHSYRKEKELSQQYQELEKDPMNSTSKETITISTPRPNTRSFNAAISAWSRSNTKGAAEKTEELLQKMNNLRYFVDGNGKDELELDNLEPDVFTYNGILQAWASSGERGAAQRVEVLLKLMEVMYRKGNLKVKPNKVSFAIAINCLAKSKEKGAALKATELLDRMEKLYNEGDAEYQPNTIIYTAVIDALAKSGERDAPEKAAELLKRMLGQQIHPNYKTYNAYINLLSKTRQMGAAIKAESILKKMEQSNNDACKPTTITYTSVIQCYSVSNEKGKAKKAKQLLEQMKKVHIRPNVYTYTAVISACASSTFTNEQEREEILQIAHSAFKELENPDNKCGYPNHVTYSTFLKACANLLPQDKKDKVSGVIFQKCVRSGQLDGTVFSQLRQIMSKDVLTRFIEEELQAIDTTDVDPECDNIDDISVKDLPHEWRSNVKDSRWTKD